MDGLFFLVIMAVAAPAAKPAASAVPLHLDDVEWRRGSKTKFCPNLVGICPESVPRVSKSGQILSQSGPNQGRTLRTGSIYSSEKLENSMAIQVQLNHWYALFQCTQQFLAREPDLENIRFGRVEIKFNLFPAGDRSKLKIVRQCLTESSG